MDFDTFLTEATAYTHHVYWNGEKHSSHKSEAAAHKQAKTITNTVVSRSGGSVNKVNVEVVSHAQHLERTKK
jgi:hypothetical protein